MIYDKRYIIKCNKKFVIKDNNIIKNFLIIFFVGAVNSFIVI